MAQSGSETQVLPQAGDAFTRALAFSDEPDVASNGTGPKKQRSKKPLIIVLVIVLVLAAIGGTAAGGGLPDRAAIGVCPSRMT